MAVSNARVTPAPNAAPKSVTVLGATGSIGVSTVDLLRRQPDAFTVEALTGNHNIALLAEQAKQLGARFVVSADDNKYLELKSALGGTGIEVAAGEDALVEAASRQTDVVVAAIVGTAGLKPAMAAASRGALVALANKECLVSAGDVMVAEIERGGATLLPVDSEHSAIFQVFDFDQPEMVESITLTASGGPFRETPLSDMAKMTPAQAVAHPNWDMGAKISVDSATMMNKGLELIEAHYLFPVAESRIDILVHPQSIIHSMVTYVDGSVLAQMGTPDMRTPIAYALSWPKRMETPSERLALDKIARLDFAAPDEVRFPSLRLAREALRSGGGAPTILNAANEAAVAKFLAGEIGFLAIAEVVEKTLTAMSSQSIETLDDVLALDQEARLRASEYCKTI